MSDVRGKARERRRITGAEGARNVEMLKPCPFCGGDAEIKEPPFAVVDGRGWFVSCVQRAAPPVHDTPTRESVAYAYGSTKNEAIAAWNRRAGDQREDIR